MCRVLGNAIFVIEHQLADVINELGTFFFVESMKKKINKNSITGEDKITCNRAMKN